MDRFRDVPRAARLEAALAVARHSQRSERHDRNSGGGGISLQLASEVETSLARQLNVHQDEIGLTTPDGFPGRKGIRSQRDPIALALQNGARKKLIRFVVLDDQDKRVAFHLGKPGDTITCRSKLNRSEAPVDPRLRMVETWPLRCLMSLSVSVLAVKTMIGMARVASWSRNASTTSNPVTPGIIRSSITRSGIFARATSIASLPPEARRTAKPAGSSTFCSQSRFASSSSTTRTVIFSPGPRLKLKRARRLIKSFAGTGLTK